MATTVAPAAIGQKTHGYCYENMVEIHIENLWTFEYSGPEVALSERRPIGACGFWYAICVRLQEKGIKCILTALILEVPALVGSAEIWSVLAFKVFH